VEEGLTLGQSVSSEAEALKRPTCDKAGALFASWIRMRTRSAVTTGVRRIFL
jgi:hypothetical protein